MFHDYTLTQVQNSSYLQLTMVDMVRQPGLSVTNTTNKHRQKIRTIDMSKEGVVNKTFCNQKTSQLSKQSIN